MNILFLLKNLSIGGVEVVSVILANKFVEEGHHVSFFIRERDKNEIEKMLSSKIRVYKGYGDYNSKTNVDALHEAYVKENVNVVVNQWGLSYKHIRLARKAEREHPVKIISFHHNDPAINGRLNSVIRQINDCRQPLKKWLLCQKRSIIRLITSCSMKYTYRHSDKFMVLSDSYLKRLQDFIHVPAEAKQGVLTNPITVNNKDFVYSKNEKNKEIIFCGRIDNIQKCPIRVLDVWEKLYVKFPDWILRFVGDGPDKKNIEKEVLQRGLKNVFFEGFQNPVTYYKNASILVMTSDFEGFPLVLVECMGFGVVPCVYNSFAALQDIVKDEKNGIIVEKKSGGFSSENMAKKIEQIIVDEKKRSSMALAAVETSQFYSIEFIYNRWDELFKTLS